MEIEKERPASRHSQRALDGVKITEYIPQPDNFVNGGLIIPQDIESLSKWDQVQVFHQHGDIVVPLQRTNTLLKKTKRRLDDHELNIHFGNGAELNIGVVPKAGEIVIDLDGRELGDVRRFLETRQP